MLTILRESLYMSSISLPRWRSPRCFQYVLSMVSNSVAFCDKPSKWQTTISILLHMGCTSSGYCGSFRRYFLEVVKTGVWINILNNTRNQAWFGKPSKVSLICLQLSLLWFSSMVCRNYWKWWKYIKFQGLPDDCEWVHSFSSLGSALYET